MDCKTTSRIVKVKARKAFVPPLLKNATAKYTSPTKLPRVKSACTSDSLKKSGYFSRPAQLHPMGPTIIPKDHHKNNSDEGSLWGTSTDAQNSELADHMECSNDGIICPDVDKVLKNGLCSTHEVLLMKPMCRLRQTSLFVL